MARTKIALIGGGMIGGTLAHLIGLNRFTGDEEKKAALVSRVPLKRAGLPEEIAQTIVFLASEKASFITGVSIAVDGGKLAG
jgi:NAD(P)-dependent dehydrogenase (short-subunit alcohol dehydrogenase family)